MCSTGGRKIAPPSIAEAIGFGADIVGDRDRELGVVNHAVIEGSNHKRALHSGLPVMQEHRSNPESRAPRLSQRLFCSATKDDVFRWLDELVTVNKIDFLKWDWRAAHEDLDLPDVR